jgi:hypothetical protein
MHMIWGVPVSPPSPEEIEPEWDAFLSGLPLEKVDWTKYTEEGPARTAIVQQAERVQANIIVMGTHGRSGLPHLLLGSVAEKVVRTAPCPVMTIRPDAFQFNMPVTAEARPARYARACPSPRIRGRGLAPIERYN